MCDMRIKKFKNNSHTKTDKKTFSIVRFKKFVIGKSESTAFFSDSPLFDFSY